MSPKSIAVIVTSVRAARIGLGVGEIVQNAVKSQESDEITFPIVDLAKFKLPVYDEGVHPAMVPFKASFQYEHSKIWSAEIAKHAGYILVIPEYNYGMSGGTKNAIDYLFNEWKGKPVAIISYGIHGGAHAGGQAYEVLSQMGLRVCPTRPKLAYHGGAGPDMFLAMEGKIGDDTRKDMEGKSGKILKTVDELKAALKQEDLYVRPRAW